MSTRSWSFLLQYARVGISAGVFLIATRYLSLAEIGFFATAFAPIKMMQPIHKAGISECVIIYGKNQRRLEALFFLSMLSGTALSIMFFLAGWAFSFPLLSALACVPFFHGIGAVSEGLLRKSLAIRALALRTVSIQIFAAGTAIAALQAGAGSFALVMFVGLNAVLCTIFSCLLAKWHPAHFAPKRLQKALLGKLGRIAGRDLINGAEYPLVQLAVALVLGATAAGAFQIATRLLTLLEALSVSPLRFIALPQILADRSNGLSKHLNWNTILAAWLWGGAFVIAPDIITVAAGPQHAAATVPIFRALIGAGLINALMMPIYQALASKGALNMLFKRASVNLCLSILITGFTVWLSPGAVGIGLSTAAACTTVWFLPKAVVRLSAPFSMLQTVWRPLSAGVVMCTCLLSLQDLNMVASIFWGTMLFGLLVFFPIRPKQELQSTPPSDGPKTAQKEVTKPPETTRYSPLRTLRSRV